MGVLNTVLMSVMERMRELGVMLALGVKRSRVAGLVLLEGLVLGVLAAVVGLGLGVAAVAPFLKDGMDLTAMMGGETMEIEGVAMSAIITPALDWPAVAAFCGLAVAFTVLSAVWPAVHAARLQPVDAMRHI